MKKSFLLLLLISLFWSSTVHAELTKKDLEGMEARLDLKISVLQKEIQGEIKALDTKLEERFGAVDKRFETINAKFEAINTRFDAINTRFDAINARMDDLKTTLILICGIFVAVLGLPQILAYFKDRREKREAKEAEVSAQEFAELKAQVEVLMKAQQKTE